MLGRYGDDPQVIAEAKTIAGKYLADPSSVEPTLAHAAVSIAAIHGDEALYDQLQHISVTSTNPEVAVSALYDLARFRDPALEKRTLEYAISGKVRNQDSASLIGVLLANRETRELAWKFVQDNWDKVKAQTTMSSGGRLIGATGGFCTVEKRDEVTSFLRDTSSAFDRAGACSCQEPNRRLHRSACRATAASYGLAAKAVAT